MSTNTIKPYINMMLFAMQHDLPWTAFAECSEGLSDLLALALKPFGCAISPFKYKAVGNTVHRWTMDAFAPFMQESTSVTLTVEIVPWDKRWQVHATFNPGNNGQSDIFDTLKGNDINGDGAIYRLVHNIVHRVNTRLVRDRLSPGQKVTFSFDSLFVSINGTPGTRYTREGVLMCDPPYDGESQYAVDGQPVAEDLDELTVIEVGTNGDVTFKGPKGIPFTLDTEETIAAIPELQL